LIDAQARYSFLSGRSSSEVTVTPALVEAQDTAYRIVTLCMAGEYDRIGSELAELSAVESARLVCVLADLVAFVSHQWAEAAGVPTVELWSRVATELVARRLTQ
jgi:hypothetical protein